MATVQIVDTRTTRISNIKELQKSPIRIAEILPFRVSFTNIGIKDIYSPLNPAPIGIAVIGINNYIL